MLEDERSWKASSRLRSNSHILMLSQGRLVGIPTIQNERKKGEREKEEREKEEEKLTPLRGKDIWRRKGGNTHTENRVVVVVTKQVDSRRKREGKKREMTMLSKKREKGKKVD